MTFRESIPTAAALDALIDERLSGIVEKVNEVSGPLESDYHRYNFWNRFGIGIPFFAIGCFSLMGAALSDEVSIPWNFVVVLFGLFSCSIFCMVLVYRHMRQFSNNFFNVTQSVLYEQAFLLLGLTDAVRNIDSVPRATVRKNLSNVLLMLKGAADSSTKLNVLTLLDRSELITEPRNTVVVDDSFQFTVNNNLVTVTELHVSHVTGSGKNRHVKQIFKGYFASCTLPNSFSGKTFVSTDGDRDGFGHQGFWSNITDSTEVEETVLEWNEFEDLLHVATSNPVEARTILAPDTMSRLYDWWQGQDVKQNIRLSFLHSHFSILFPTSHVQFFSTIGKITPEEIREELAAITKPLLPILHLVEAIPTS